MGDRSRLSHDRVFVREKVAPEELEEKILALPGIREVVVSGNGDSREIKAEVYAVVSEESARRAIGVLNNSMPVHKRVRTVVVRSEPFPRTDSGKIRVKKETLSEGSEHKLPAAPDVMHECAVLSEWKIFGLSIVCMVILAVAAMAMAVLGIVPCLLTGKGVHMSQSVVTAFEVVDIAGELLLGLLVLLFVFRMRDRHK